MRKIKKMKLKKEIVANLSDAESKQIRGGMFSASHGYCCSITDCSCNSNFCGSSGDEYC